MDLMRLQELANAFLQKAPENRITREEAYAAACLGQPIFDEILLSAGNAHDPLFNSLREPQAIGPHFMPPRNWLSEAQSVISICYVFGECFHQYSGADFPHPGGIWLRGPEGDQAINVLLVFLRQTLQKAGGLVAIPRLDERFWFSHNLQETEGRAPLSSNWSERHVAYVCGLGTFGLSRTILSPKGAAVILRSLITDLHFPPDPRPYQGLEDNCTRCAACARGCPAHAIDPKQGKDCGKCLAFLQQIWQTYPGHSCFGCQVMVPCARKRPRS